MVYNDSIDDCMDNSEMVLEEGVKEVSDSAISVKQNKNVN